MLEIQHCNDCLRYILRCLRIDRVPTTTLRHHLRPLPSVPDGSGTQLDAQMYFSPQLAKTCRWEAEDVGQHSQGWPSSTIRSPSSGSSAMESRLACHFFWPGSGSANVGCDGSRCCTCSEGSRFNPTRVKADTSQVKSMLEIWGGGWWVLSLPLLQSTLLLGVVAPNRVLSMGQIEPNCTYAKVNCLK